MAALLLQEEELRSENASLKQAVRGKDSDVGHLMEECRQYKEEMALLYDEIKWHQAIHSEQI
jgi:hypothetical protein